VNDELVAALADALGAPLPSERVALVASQLEGQLAGQGGSSAEELVGVEPALIFDPTIAFDPAPAE
jgi:hypothetical protein